MADDPTAPETDVPAEPAEAAAGGAGGASDRVAEAAGTAGKDTTAPAKEQVVVRKKVTSRRVTPKGGAPAAGAKGGSGPGGASKTSGASGTSGTSGNPAKAAKAKAEADAAYSARYTPPRGKADAQMPSPPWVPVLMFALLILGGLVIVANYARLFGEPDNTFLFVGLGLILGGIITATNYR